MKRLILILATWLLCSPMVFAGASTDYIEFDTISNVGTNGAAVTTNTSKRVDGYIDAVYVDVGGLSGLTVDVSVVTSGYTPSRTILATNAITVDTWFYPRAASVNTAGTPVSGGTTRIPLVRDALKSWGDDAIGTGVHVKVWVLYTDMP